MTALDQAIRRDKPERDAMIFERMAEGFIKQWAPDDPRENAEFCAQLFTILRQLSIDVQAPMAEQLAKAYGMMPMVLPSTK